MKALQAISAAAALLVLSACAGGPETAQNNDGFDDLQTRTGSNMLVRVKNSKSDKNKDSTGAQELVEEMRANAEKPYVNLDK
jgi:hypothetical protein